MSFLQYFKNLSNSNGNEALNCSELEKIMQSNFPGLPEQDHAKLSCVAGLLTRVAYVDLEISQEEQESIIHNLKFFLDLDENRRPICSTNEGRMETNMVDWLFLLLLNPLF